jgi:ribosomal protein L4
MNVRPDRTTKYTKSGLISGKTMLKKALFKYKKEKQLILQQYLIKMSVRKLKPLTQVDQVFIVNGYDAITTDKPEKPDCADKTLVVEIVKER